jgi:hypothetical protein
MSEKREEIREKIHKLSLEIARLAEEMRKDEDVPLGVVHVTVVDILGVAQVFMGVEVATEEELRELGIPFDEMQAALAEVQQPKRSATEEVDELLKGLRRPGGAAGTN